MTNDAYKMIHPPTPVRGYKMLTPDFIAYCLRNFQYKVGETYEMLPLPILNKRGFHFCRDIAQCYDFYVSGYDYTIVEVEPLGFTLEGFRQCVTNKIRIVREIPRSEFRDLGW